MNNVYVYCEIEDGVVAEVSQELLTKGRSLAARLNCRLEAVAVGHALEGVGPQVFPYGVDVLHVFDDARLAPYTSLPHAAILTKLFEREKPQIALMGATSLGRDLGPRVSSALGSGLTADCTSLEIDEQNLLLQIRPAFGGNIIATIINPDCRPQMATVREGVMKKEVQNAFATGEIKSYQVNSYVNEADFAVSVIERRMEKSKTNIKASGVIVAGGYGVGSKENFQLLHELAAATGGQVGASRAAVDAGFAEHERQIGQTGLTVRPKLYIACGISGQIQHLAGMQESAIVISVNNDPNAPINAIADYVITGTVEEVIPKMIRFYRKNTQ
ncbi:MAG: electron transfer flavoprotein subunit alpha/FixB family protein [Tannerellaceae bacterium]|jgi:electron transfer flavoprotein alpha subunit|nr:electron transfer flavoprotein subunit alpha/FixB family protein [Tannerellaceae bacterium]